MSEEQKTTPVVTVEETKSENTTPKISVNQDSKNFALICHLSGILFSFIVPLIVYLVKSEDKYLVEEAKEALNFQITLAIAMFACSILGFLILPLLFIPVLWIVNLVFCIIAALAINDKGTYKYPFALRLIK